MTEMAPLRFMTFNLRRDVEADGDNNWTRRRDAAAALVRQHAPHVLATQEGLPHQLADLDARLPHLRRVGGCRRGDGTDEHTAIFYDASRLFLVATGDLWLSDTPGEPGSRTWGNRLPRMVTWARFTDQDTGSSFTVANTHLDHESPEARRRSAAFLRERMPNAILLGDFNAQPGDDVHRILTQTWRDAHDEADATADGHTHTFHGFTGMASVRFDWILAPSRVRVLEHRVVKERAEGRYVSDHHPVLASLVVRR